MIKNHYLLTMKFCSIMQAFPEFPLRPRTWTLATEFVTSPSKNSWRPPVSSGHQRWLGNPQSKWRLRAGKFMRKSGNGGQSRKHGGLEGKSSKKMGPYRVYQRCYDAVNNATIPTEMEIQLAASNANHDSVVFLRTENPRIHL